MIRLVSGLVTAALFLQSFVANPHQVVIEGRYLTVSRTVDELLPVHASVYHATAGQTDNNPLQTASGKMITRGVRWVALSRDLLGKTGLSYGDTVEIISDDARISGKWIIEDKMGAYRGLGKRKRRTRQSADFLQPRSVRNCIKDAYICRTRTVKDTITFK